MGCITKDEVVKILGQQGYPMSLEGNLPTLRKGDIREHEVRELFRETGYMGSFRWIQTKESLQTDPENRNVGKTDPMDSMAWREETAGYPHSLKKQPDIGDIVIEETKEKEEAVEAVKGLLEEGGFEKAKKTASDFVVLEDGQLSLF